VPVRRRREQLWKPGPAGGIPFDQRRQELLHSGAGGAIAAVAHARDGSSGAVVRASARRDVSLRLVHRLFQPVPADRRVRRVSQLFAGLVLFGATAAMLVLAGLGLDPWDVLHQGLSRTFGLGIGTWTIIVSVLVLISWRALRQRLGAGTVANAIIVGLVIDLVLALFHPPQNAWVRVALLIGAVIGNGIATGLYIGAGLGPGPRDGLSTGIAARGHSMRVVRTTIELTVLVSGFLLGGTVGIGTLLYALAIGPITHQTIPALMIGRASRRRASRAPRRPRRREERCRR
jgi:uncharacterized membrane protein YczE